MPFFQQAKLAAEETRKVTPYDDELADALDAQEKITMLLGHMRDVLSEYHAKHGLPEVMANLSLDAEHGFYDAFSDLIGGLEKLVDQYNPEEEAGAARADRIIDEWKESQ